MIHIVFHLYFFINEIIVICYLILSIDQKGYMFVYEKEE